MFYWTHKLRYYKGQLQEKVLVDHIDDNGNDCCREEQWKDIPETNNIDDRGDRQED